MPRINSFTNLSLDGYFADLHDDMSWAHKHDPEWLEFVAANASSGGQLLFGRKTYDLMAAYWPTPLAAQQNPTVAAGMNAMPKYVASRTLTHVTWSNTTLLQGDLLAAVRKLKAQPGPDITILGSGSIVSQLTAAGLIDQLQIVVHPILLGQGKKLFSTLTERKNLTLLSSRQFTNGAVVLSYS